MLVIACAVLMIQLGGSLGQSEPVNNNGNGHWKTETKGQWKIQSETITLDFTSCRGWTYTAITEDVARVTFRPEEFPAGCSPEKTLLVTSHFSTKGDCPTGEKCENEKDKLETGVDICYYSDTMMDFFTSNSGSSTKEFVMESEPICSEEKKVLFAVQSLCLEPVKVHIEVETRAVENDILETCHPEVWGMSLLFIILKCAGVLAVAISSLVFCIKRFLRNRKENISSSKVMSYAPIAGHAAETQPFARSMGPASNQLPPSLL